jgi:beta-glucosidase
VTLHHFVHPAWLGADPWLEREYILPHFLRFVETTVEYLNRQLIDRFHVAPIKYYLTINEPNTLALSTYMGHQFPTARTDFLFETVVGALVNLMIGHVKAYECIHRIYESHGWMRPEVALNNFCGNFYWFDKGLLDVLTLKQAGIKQEDAIAHLSAQELELERAAGSTTLLRTRTWTRPVRELIVGRFQRLIREVFRSPLLSPLLGAVYQSEHARLFDFIAINYYNPVASDVIRFPSLRDLELKHSMWKAKFTDTITEKWWDWKVVAKGLRFFCPLYAKAYPGLPIIIAENGMAHRRTVHNRQFYRADRMTRSQFLELHIREIAELIREGLPIKGYFYWSLFDNYEWGTFAARFGLYSLDYQNGLKRMREDHLGDCPSETYRRLLVELA